MGFHCLLPIMYLHTRVLLLVIITGTFKIGLDVRLFKKTRHIATHYHTFSASERARLQFPSPATTPSWHVLMSTICIQKLQSTYPHCTLVAEIYSTIFSQSPQHTDVISYYSHGQSFTFDWKRPTSHPPAFVPAQYQSWSFS